MGSAHTHTHTQKAQNQRHTNVWRVEAEKATPTATTSASEGKAKGIEALMKQEMANLTWCRQTCAAKGIISEEVAGQCQN